MSFGNHILNYLRKTWKKRGKFEENFWEILDWIRRSVMNTLMKSRTNFKKLLEVNVELILRKLWRNIRGILYYWFCKNYKEILKMLLWNFSEIMNKIWRNGGNTLYKFFNILREILWYFLVNFWKNFWKIIGKIWEILYRFRFLQECCYHPVYYDCAEYFPTSNQLMFQFL